MSKVFDLPIFGRNLNLFFQATLNDKEFHNLKQTIREIIQKADHDDLLDIAKVSHEYILRTQKDNMSEKRKIVTLMESVRDRILVIVAEKRKEDPGFVVKTITEFQEIFGDHPELSILERYKEQIVSLEKV